MRSDSRRVWAIVIVGALLFGIIVTALDWNTPISNMF